MAAIWAVLLLWLIARASRPVGSENPHLFALNVHVQSEGFLNRSKEARAFLVEALASFRLTSIPRPIECAKCLH